ncbi:hypothetical protein P344_04900 [Spiroplasma mirum ATCC 29335]|uniref:DNA primase n=1 Tax=Spiroplasma mirum ATCC 29335 TaxID=838561 RepID=W0GRP0_9MOLU|nr:MULTISPECIES: DNA primase [Spiroplasma]AHF61216.1 putative DNA primase [Spiroplasma mirum ATCC 29335]AHI58302.1 hypothetical protein P344_04900 [Spiroplasma mirum ATCC 29335]AKM53294.1 DNA primase [Spiroplasma atrichopogonis]
MALVSNEKIDLIRSKVDIVTIISQYLKLEKRGRNYWAVCPFHQDSHPSMSISPEKQIYRCFACSSGGNIFTFLQEYKNIPFVEVLKELAASAGISLTELDNYQVKSRYDDLDKKIFALNEVVKTYFINNLNTKKGQSAREYLTSRHIDHQQIEEFMIGYADNAPDSLYQFLLQKGYHINEMETAGLVSIKNEKVYDYFNNRVMFPILDDESNLIGFSGRVLTDTDHQVKYLNTPETKVFKKERLMYNIQNAKLEARKLGHMILLEGYMDVISLTKIDIKNTVALMGTNLSSYHLQALKKITNECLIFLDGDTPGVKASLKAAGKLLANNFKVKIVNNETNQDPDELVNSGQADVISAMLSKATHPVSFAINYYHSRFNLTDGNELQEFINIVGPLIKATDNAIEQELYINNLVQVTNIGKETLISEINNLISSQPVKVPKQNQVDLTHPQKIKKTSAVLKTTTQNALAYKIKTLKRYLLAEQQMILQLLNSRKAADFYEKKISILNDNDNRLIANYIIDYYHRHLGQESVNINMLCNEINEEKLINQLTMILNSSTFKTEYNTKALEDYAILINDFATEKEIAMLRAKLKKTTDIIEQQVISTEIDKMNLRLKFKKG